MSGAIIKAEVMVEPQLLEHKVEQLLDEKTMLQIHNLFAQMCDEYVPFYEGPLSQTLEITSKYVRYTVPYAHYQYMGEIYGPNIPIMQEGEIEGWFSPKGQKKNPTGRQMKHTTVYHPKASSKWDKAMMLEKGEVFSKYVENILKARAKELYG